MPDASILEPAAQDAPRWIAAFIQKHGRAPRILHLGNIANNAYQTAKMLNAAGADCDVLCADYYHIMGTPEWDDADFEGDVGSHAYPAWHRVNLHGFVRPRWFSQGPRQLAIAYLLAKRRGKAARAAKLWNTLTQKRAKLAEYALKPGPWAEDAGAPPPQNAAQKLAQRLRLGLEVLLPGPASENATRYSRGYAAAMQQKLARDAKAYFPGKAMVFGPQADYYIRAALAFKPLFALYDLVQGYATEAIWPYLCGCKHYVAWEHGTLRTFPYEDNDRGRLLLLSYAAAGAVTVTNVDCYDSAMTITKHSGAPIVCGLHGFDTERMLQKQAAALQQTGAIPQFAATGKTLLFCPARADIDPHYGTYLKANDRLYLALAQLYQNRGGAFQVLQLDWGNNTDDLKRFIAEECGALAEAVLWRKPFSKPVFYQLLQQTALVFDNFLLPLMGGNGIETLMSGHAALVNKRIPNELMLRFFPEAWPVFSVDDEADITAAAQTALDDPAACLALAQKGREWILKYHNHAAIVAKNCEAYQHILPLL